MDAEQIGPAWDRFRHAELLAATLNGGAKHADGRPFMAADFLIDPWVEPVAPIPKEIRRKLLQAELAGMESAFVPEEA